MSGLFISIGSILLFYALGRGGPVASTGTIVLGGGVTTALAVLATEAPPKEESTSEQKEAPEAARIPGKA